MVYLSVSVSLFFLLYVCSMIPVLFCLVWSDILTGWDEYKRHFLLVIQTEIRAFIGQKQRNTTIPWN